MLTIILFGAGWKGDVWALESYSPVIKAPDQTFRLLKSSGVPRSSRMLSLMFSNISLVMKFIWLAVMGISLVAM